MFKEEALRLLKHQAHGYKDLKGELASQVFLVADFMHRSTGKRVRVAATHLKVR